MLAILTMLNISSASAFEIPSISIPSFSELKHDFQNSTIYNMTTQEYADVGNATYHVASEPSCFICTAGLTAVQQFYTMWAGEIQWINTQVCNWRTDYTYTECEDMNYYIGEFLIKEILKADLGVLNYMVVCNQYLGWCSSGPKLVKTAENTCEGLSRPAKQYGSSKTSETLRALVLTDFD